MPDQLVSVVLTEKDQMRLERLHYEYPDFGRCGEMSLIEDVIARKVWDVMNEVRL